MSARWRTARDLRRRGLGQNFLDPATADALVESSGFRPGELVVEIGAGRGAITRALAARGLSVLAVEVDPFWAERLRHHFWKNARVRILQADFLKVALPAEPFRVCGSLPYHRTTEILRRLLDDPTSRLCQADLVVQWEVARKRASLPPKTLLSTAWAPWWETRLIRRVPASAFRPVPRIDSALISVTRRDPPLLPPEMAMPYAEFLRAHWPFGPTPVRKPGRH